MTRGRYRFDPETNKIIPITDWLAKYGPDGSARSDMPAPYVIGAMDEYRSMATGEMITDRRRHREHLRERGLVEVGNEKTPPRQPVAPSPAGQDIKNAIEHLRAGNKAEPVETIDSDTRIYD